MSSESAQRQFKLGLKLEIAIGVSLCGLWLSSHPYIGIGHDATLYTVQALKHLHPEVYGRDPFFAAGSQDEYTVFSPAYAWAIRLWGVGMAAYALTVFGKVLWLAAIAALAATLLRGPLVWLGLALVVCVPPYYGGDDLFAYGESCITARLYAESVGLLALCLALRKQWSWAFILAAAAAAIHPLMTLPVMAVIVLLRLPAERCMAAAVLGGIAVWLVAILLSSPDATAGIARLYDPQWYDYVRARSPFAFIGSWSPEDWSAALVPALALASGSLVGNTGLRTACRALLAATAGALVVAAVGAGIYHHVLVTQLQLWRFLWLFQLVGLVVLAEVLRILWTRTAVDRWQAFILVCALLLPAESRWWVGGIGSALWLWLRRYRPAWRPGRMHWVLGGAVAGTVLGLNLWRLVELWPGLENGTNEAKLRAFLENPFLLLVAAAVVVMGCRLSRAMIAYLALAAAGGFAGMAIFFWFVAVWQHNPRVGERYESKAQLEFRAFIQRTIPPAATVYWEQGAAMTWFLLGRAHYASFMQGAGAMFSRESSMTLMRRERLLRGAGFGAGTFFLHLPPAGANLRHSADDLAMLCSDRDLDFAILDNKANAAPDLAFKVDGWLRGYLYRCERFRNSGSSPS